MSTVRTCSWCHHLNYDSDRYCQNCCHEAHVARERCECPRCWPVLPPVDPDEDGPSWDDPVDEPRRR